LVFVNIKKKLLIVRCLQLQLKILGYHNSIALKIISITNAAFIVNIGILLSRILGEPHNEQ